MPYIDPESRPHLEPNQVAATPGELNYQITRLVDGFLPRRPNYRDLNEVVGVLEVVKLELYRRVVAPYEDVKLAENGDVYTAEAA